MSNVRYGPDEITNQTCPMRVAESALVGVQLTAIENPNGDVVVANQQACETSVHGETGVVAPTQRMCNTDSGHKQREEPESLVSEQRDSAYRIGNKSCTRIPSPPTSPHRLLLAPSSPPPTSPSSSSSSSSSLFLVSSFRAVHLQLPFLSP